MIGEFPYQRGQDNWFNECCSTEKKGKREEKATPRIREWPRSYRGFSARGNIVHISLFDQNLKFQFAVPDPRSGFQVPLTEKLSLSSLEKSRISGSIGHCRRPPGQSDTEPSTPMVIESSNHRVMPSRDR